MSVHLLGIRHHGPGSARSVVAALEAIQPKTVLVEGPPDADDLLALAADAEMRPPVALLVYRPDAPKHAVFYPFAQFSPEWQAIRWALAHAVPVRFMDLPQRYQLATPDTTPEDADEPSDGADGPADGAGESGDGDKATAEALRDDPLALLAQAAGYADSERWWEERFEARHGGEETFAVVLELMTALRAEHAMPCDPQEAQREAWMRQTLRAALQEQDDAPIAVVCGAWHVPALATLPTAKSDAQILKGLAKTTVAATWLPWTHRRLTFASGYGAGIHSPGYYEELWTLAQRDRLAMRWMTRVAHLLRAEDLESSTASIIEATRLAEATAALRGRALPGLAEFNEAAQAVFCFGNHTPIGLIQERLIVGHALGAVPEAAPQVPLQRDFLKETKRLRLPPEALDRSLDLDLRKPLGLDCSRLLHRLRLLKVNWGRLGTARGKGTFREMWQLRWEPELEVALIEAAPWGNTIAEAAARYCVQRADDCTTLAELTALLEMLMLAELPAAVAHVMQCLANQAALTSDVGHLMDALPPLAAVLRYGNVRQTDASMVGHIVTGLVARICAGLRPSCASLSDEAAAEMLTRLNATHSALTTLADDALLALWRATLQELADDDHLHGVLGGRCTRVLFDAGGLTRETVATRLARRLSRANAPDQAAAWLDGFLSGSGLVLLHQTDLWNLIDNWLCALTADHLTASLPLLRRTFGSFSPPERRQLGHLAQQGSRPAQVTPPVADDVDAGRANRLLSTFAMLLGTGQDTP